MAQGYGKGEEDYALKLWVVLSRANRAVTDQINEDIQSYGLNPTEFAVLELLFHKGDQQIQHIGKKILLSSGSITYVVDKLQNKGLLNRRPCPDDRRVSYAAITERGKQLMQDIFPKHQKAINGIFDVLNTEEKQQMIKLLKKLGFSVERKNVK
ncbi:MarR family 2-MHQ and catechol resistance regulon transcriptional repressor [Scopulibacillus darangshiensis]|uniref:MarR family 2-MHQ and catechol resistance regulon transcriptional repressor n=1 Tax=Scopulibacillus darangshiensis TaxID=442528 RepID=A0A4R2NGG8_9BACL|nr:MarR family transcriptional regulator [Scopulibacillus darangshiensis]TCP20298.1 MarR family 2-MHQ and catechol resistance regulon transcriptional repressor [Scopulibacillus darangshiensis]